MSRNSLTDLSTGELVERYNDAAAKLNRKPVKRFKDRIAAQRRTADILEALQTSMQAHPTKTPAKPAKKTPAKPAKKTGVKAKTERKKRGMRFIFPFHGTSHLKSLRDTKTLRGRCVELLKDGAKFTDVERLVQQFCKEKGRTTEHVERQAYELVRIMHYYLGYGVTHTEDGTIRLHTRAPG